MDLERPEPRYSLVIPAHNEAACLPRLLDSVDVAREGYRYGSDAVEVIVADNGSTDATDRIARDRGCHVAVVDERCIAAARNGGAGLARGEYVAFVDADMQIHPRTFDAIDRALGSRRCIGGATGVTLERWSPGLFLTYVLMAPIATIANIDTGVVFCRREDFTRIGGYDESRKIAEDVDFLFRLKRLGRQDGRRFVRVTTAKAVSSCRKFDKHGDWHYFTMGPKLVFELLFRRQAYHARVQTYWYRDR